MVGLAVTAISPPPPLCLTSPSTALYNQNMTQATKTWGMS